MKVQVIKQKFDKLRKVRIFSNSFFHILSVQSYIFERQKLLSCQKSSF